MQVAKWAHPNKLLSLSSASSPVNSYALVFLLHHISQGIWGFDLGKNT